MASDFGSSASIYRRDGKPPQREDEERIIAAARLLQSVVPNRINSFAGLELVLGSCQDADYTEGVDVRLTSYFSEDEDNEQNKDAIIARDEMIAQQFARELQEALGEEFRVEWYSGSW